MYYFFLRYIFCFILCKNVETKLFWERLFSVSLLENSSFFISFLFKKVFSVNMPYLSNFKTSMLLAFRTVLPKLWYSPLLKTLSKYIHSSSSLIDLVWGCPINFIISFLLLVLITSCFDLFSRNTIPWFLLGSWN